jgi:DNA processing protein
VAILPCGIDYPYLMDNALLRREILDMGGALISEFPMNTPVQRGSFQIRNRLISGIAHGVLVAEAPQKSGALITARHALEQNREVFAFIGADDKKFEGCAALIKDGAKRVLTAQDILKSFPYMQSMLVKAPSIVVKEEPKPVEKKRAVKPVRVMTDSEPQKENAMLSSVSDAAKQVYGVLRDTPLHASEIEQLTGLGAGDILAALTELELFGLACTSPGQRFTKSE